MFGYVKPSKPDLTIRDFNNYQAVYCGLCGQLGKSFGCFARLTLSYDFTFLCMLHASLSPEECAYERRRCYVNPMKKVPVCALDKPMRFAADVAAIMIYYKLCDNLQDSTLGGKIAWGSLYIPASAAHKKAAAAQPVCEEVLREWVRSQAELEGRNTPNVDEACEPTALAMGRIFAMLSPDRTVQRVLERLGYFIGRYTYLCDALDDLEKDAKSGNYNPFLLRHALQSPTREQLRKVREDARDSLFMTVAEAGRAYALLEIHQFRPVLDNILDIGLRANVEAILSKVGGKTQ